MSHLLRRRLAAAISQMVLFYFLWSQQLKRIVPEYSSDGIFLTFIPWTWFVADDIGFESLAEVLTPWQVLPLEGSSSLVFHTLYSSWESHQPLLRDKERANYRHESRGMVARSLPPSYWSIQTFNCTNVDSWLCSWCFEKLVWRMIQLTASDFFQLWLLVAVVLLGSCVLSRWYLLFAFIGLLGLAYFLALQSVCTLSSFILRSKHFSKDLQLFFLKNGNRNHYLDSSWINDVIR